MLQLIKYNWLGSSPQWYVTKIKQTWELTFLAGIAKILFQSLLSESFSRTPCLILALENICIFKELYAHLNKLDTIKEHARLLHKETKL